MVALVAAFAPRVRQVARRWYRLVGLSGRTATRAAVHSVRRVSVRADRRPDLDAAFQLRTAGDVTETLGQMKGVMMKLGQMASFLDDGLPEAVRATLAQLQDSAPPMTPALAAGVIRAELGAPPERVFRSWDPRPIAAASIGQVHRAVLDDGTVVAVKVQYPGVDETMRADLDQLELGRLMMPVMAPTMDYGAIVSELRDRLTEELDYTVEAANQRQFADWYDGHPFIDIPRVVDELSTRRVLVTSLSGGMRFADLERATQADRDLAAEAIYRFVHRSIHDHQAFNGDPHPGNYLFDPGGSVTFLDFGLVKHLTPRARDLTLAQARTCGIEPDEREARMVAEASGFFPPCVPLTDEQTFSFGQMFWSYLLEDQPVTLTKQWASEVVRRYILKDDLTRDINRWSTIPADFVIMQRIHLGLFAVLGRLNATANWRRILLELWWGERPATPMGELEAAWLASRP